MVFASPSLAIISHTWAEDLSVSQFLITKTIMTDRVRFTDFPDFTWKYLNIPENTVKKFLCFSQVFFEPCLKSNLIWPRWCRNKILDSVRKNTLISSNCPYVPHLLLERLNRYQKPELIYNQNFSDIELFNSCVVFSTLSFNTICTIIPPVTVDHP